MPVKRLAKWLHGSLRRWLMAPVMALAIVLVVVAGLSVNHLVGQAADQGYGQLLGLAAELAASSASSEASALVASVDGLAQGSLVGALETGDPGQAPQRMGELLRPLDVEAAVIVQADGAQGALVTGLNGDPSGAKGSALLTAPAIQRDVAAILSEGVGAPARSGLAEVGGEVAFYVASRVRSSTGVDAVLVCGAPAQRLLRAAVPAMSHALVLYDALGRPVYSSLAGSGTAGEQLATLGAQLGRVGASGEPLRATLAGTLYGYQLRSVGVGGRAIAYLAVWQPLAVGAVRWVTTVFVGMLALVVMGVVWLAYRLASSVSEPIAGMAQAARALSDGQEPKALPVVGVGELRSLSEAIGSVTQQLGSQHGALSEQARIASYLFEASAEIGRTLDLGDALQTAADAIYGLGGLAYLVILTGRGELGLYTCRAVRGLNGGEAGGPLGKVYAVPLWGVMARALVSRQPLVIEDVVAERRPRPGELDWDVGRGSMLLFPVVGAAGPSGLIIAGTVEPGAFSKGSLGDVVFALARIAAQSVQNAMLYQEAVRSQEQLVTLQAVSRLMASSREIESVLQVVVREAADLMGGCEAWLYLRDEGGGRLLAQDGTFGPAPVGGVHRDAVDWAMQSGQPAFYDPEQGLAASPILMRSGPAMCVPLEASDEALGALVVSSERRGRAFSEDDMIVLRTLINVAGVAMRTMQLAERLDADRLSMARAWSACSEAHVAGRAGHSQRVAANVCRLAKATGVSPSLWPVLNMAAYLHDVALERPRTESEVGGESAPSHAMLAADWLAEAGCDGRVVSLVRQHHSLGGSDSPGEPGMARAASILALCNTIDGWLAGSEGCPGLDPAELRGRLADDGLGFPPGLVSSFVTLWDAGRLAMP